MTTTIVKTMVLLAVHGDVDEERDQRILDEKSARNPRVNPLGVSPQDPSLNGLGNPHDKAAWIDRPMAACNALLVAECEDRTVDDTRLEVQVRDYAQMLGLKQGDAIKVTIGKA